MNLQDIKTKTGKTLADFSVPEKLLKEDPQLVELIIKSESMDDGERQYWFNLSEVMNKEQVEKLRDILVREKQKLAEIDAKYAQPEKADPALAMQRAQEKGARRAEQRQELKSKEAAFEAEEEKHQDSLLEKELMNL